jgi:hypothetical protein
MAAAWWALWWGTSLTRYYNQGTSGNSFIHLTRINSGEQDSADRWVVAIGPAAVHVPRA